MIGSNSTPDSMPLGSINRALWPAELASRNVNRLPVGTPLYFQQSASTTINTQRRYSMARNHRGRCPSKSPIQFWWSMRLPTPDYRDAAEVTGIEPKTQVRECNNLANALSVASDTKCSIPSASASATSTGPAHRGKYIRDEPMAGRPAHRQLPHPGDGRPSPLGLALGAPG